MPHEAQPKHSKGIWVVRKNKIFRINIETGISDDFNTEINSVDIQEGDIVIIGVDKGNTKKQYRSMRIPPM